MSDLRKLYAQITRDGLVEIDGRYVERFFPAQFPQGHPLTEIAEALTGAQSPEGNLQTWCKAQGFGCRYEPVSRRWIIKAGEEAG